MDIFQIEVACLVIMGILGINAIKKIIKVELHYRWRVQEFDRLIAAGDGEEAEEIFARHADDPQFVKYGRMALRNRRNLRKSA